MKHDMKVTCILIVLFALSQIVGLFLVAHSLEDISCSQGDCTPQYETTIIGERPQTTGGGSVLYLVAGVAIGTAVLLLIAKFNKRSWWRVWFFAAVLVSSGIALGVILPFWAAWLIALVFTIWKLHRPNIWVYNLMEILMYSGIAVLFVPILGLYWTVGLLFIISIYDMIAVWKSKHMVTMANFITESNAFAGLVVPYKSGKKPTIHTKMTTSKKASGKKTAQKNAILGGGDMTFPLLFAGVFLQDRVVKLVGSGVGFQEAVWGSYFVALLVCLGAAISIALLFVFAKKDRFYPAMPFVTAGCLFGWALTFLFYI